jgi:hypothetical protein
MRIVTNQKTIKRNRKIGQFATLGSLGILAVGFIISINPDPSLFLWALLALMVGFMLSQIGIYYGNRFGRTPRYDERLNQALKGLDEKYTLYHYMTSVPHLLVGPAGIWVLAAFGQRGTISYDANRKRWIQVGGNVFLKLFGQFGPPGIGSQKPAARPEQTTGRGPAAGSLTSRQSRSGFYRSQG